MLDKKILHILAGKGGNGSISFRTERFVANGGPNGGDGGDGGSVIFVADRGVRTLKELSRSQKAEAQDGNPGGGSNKTGRRGKSKQVRVPVGTQLWEWKDGEKVRLVGDLEVEGQKVVAAFGGEGGKGNTWFKSPTNQEPLLAEGGELGEELDVLIEVKLLADVAVVGPPNAGKSTLLSVVSAAKPVVAAYPFTTLEPVLGTVEHRGNQMVLLEVPGLLEGAHTGKGLGLEFLRHVERARVVLQLVDGLDEDYVKAFWLIDEELRLYGEGLPEKPRVVAVTKMDIPELLPKAAAQEAALAVAAGSEPELISSATHTGITKLLDRLLLMVQASVAAEERVPVREVVINHSAQRYRTLRPTVTKDEETFVVSCPPAERIAEMVNINNWKARMQFHGELDRLGVIKVLDSVGVDSGDTVRIGSLELEWQ
ncbi:MAG: GTPase ObgE [Chloroflexi bacterium]|nr:GTPase ObgE [Chloroflexota bacterium]